MRAVTSTLALGLLVLACASAPRVSARYLAEDIVANEGKVRAEQQGKEIEVYGTLSDRGTAGGGGRVAVIVDQGHRAECVLDTAGAREVERIPMGASVAAHGVLESWTVGQRSAVPRLSECWIYQPEGS